MEPTCFNVASFLAKTLNKPDEELAELLYEKSENGELTLKDDAQDTAIKLIADKIKGIKDENKTKLEDGTTNAYKKGFKEASEKFEAEVRGKYGMESEQRGIELVDEVVNKFKSDDSKLTPDKIKLTDTYRDREKQLRTEAEELIKTKDEEISNLQAGFEKKSRWDLVSGDIVKILMEKKPVLPKSPKAAETMKKLFLESFSEYDWQVADDGNHIPVKEGERVEDSLGNALKFQPLVESRIPEYFDLYKQDTKGSAGNEGDGGDTTDVPSTFKNEQEYNDYLDKETDPEKREKAYLNYKAQ